MPKLAVRKRWRPSSSNGALERGGERGRRRGAASSRLVDRARAGSRTRRRRSGRARRRGAARAASRSATATSSSSPARCPSESLMTLKSSRSAKSTATSRPRASERLGQQLGRSRRGSGSPVSGSWCAWWSSALGVALARGDVDALGDVVVGLAGRVPDERVAPAGTSRSSRRRARSGAPPRARRAPAASSARSATRSCDRHEVPDSRPSGCTWPVRSRSSRLPCRTCPSGETSAIATGASSNARRKRSSDASLAARTRSLSRHDHHVRDRQRGHEQAVDRRPAATGCGCAGRRSRPAPRRSRRAAGRRSRSPAGRPTTPRRARGRRPSRSSGSAPRSSRARRRRAPRSTSAAPSRTARSGPCGEGAASTRRRRTAPGRGRTPTPPPSDQPWRDRERGQHHQVRGQHEQEPAMTGGPDLVRQRRGHAESSDNRTSSCGRTSAETSVLRRAACGGG